MVRLANAERAAVEAARSKSEFIAHMSHELRTPLNAVIGFSEVIAQGLYGPAGHPKYTEYARDIADAGRGLHARIGDILEFANIEAGRHPLRPRSASIWRRWPRACVDEHKGRAFSRRIALDDRLRRRRARCAPIRWRCKRILSNLIANALAYTGEGGAVLVDVRVEEGAGMVAGARQRHGLFRRRARPRPAAPSSASTGRARSPARGWAWPSPWNWRGAWAGRCGCRPRPGKGSVMELRLPKADSAP